MQFKSPQEVLNKWMHGVNTGDVSLLMSLYDTQAVLIPTFSNRILNSAEKLGDYFEKLGAREELSIVLHEKSVISQAFDGNIFAISGIYTWRFAVDESLLNFEARFSYLLDLGKSKPILHHHSSQIPRML